VVVAEVVERKLLLEQEALEAVVLVRYQQLLHQVLLTLAVAVEVQEMELQVQAVQE
jgi:hypothetical protein